MPYTQIKNVWSECCTNVILNIETKSRATVRRPIGRILRNDAHECIPHQSSNYIIYNIDILAPAGRFSIHGDRVGRGGVKAGKATADGLAASKKPNNGRSPEGGYLKLTAGMAKFAGCDEVTGAAWCTQALNTSTSKH